MPRPPYVECLLFVVHHGSIPDACKSDALPINRAQILGYALLPHIRRYDELCRTFARNKIQVINGMSLDPLLTEAIKADRVEIVQILMAGRLVDASQRLLVFVERCNKYILRALMRHSRIIEAYNDLTIISSTSKTRSVLEDNLCTIKQLVFFGANIRHRFKDGGTFLHFAIRRKCEPLVKILLEHGARVNSRTLKDLTPLHEASSREVPLAVSNLLIQYGADVNATISEIEYEGVSPLHLALHRYLLNSGFFSHELDVVKTLLENGACVDGDSRLGSCLVLAVGTFSLSLVLNHRPDVNRSSNREALRILLKKTHNRFYSRCIKQLLEYGFSLVPDDANDVELLFGAVKLNSYELTEQLLNWGADPTARDDVGKTPLHKAARHAGSCLIQLLLDSGADINAKCNEGGTVLRKAAIANNVDGMKYLLANGARIQDDPDILHAVIKNGYEDVGKEVIDMLVKNGADVHAVNDKGETPILLAADSYRSRFMYSLFRYGARMDPNDKRTRNILFEMIKEKRSFRLENLISNGVAVKVDWEEVLIKAIQVGKPETVSFLLGRTDICSGVFNSVSILNEALNSRVNYVVKDVLDFGYLSLDLLADCKLFDDPTAWFDDDDNGGYDINWHLSDKSEITEMVLTHFAAVRWADLSINKKSKEDYEPSNLPPNFRDDCLKEVAAMKKEKIGETDVSYYDLLDASPVKMLRYAKNRNIVEIFEAVGDLGLDYYIYGDMILYRFLAACRQRKLIENGVKMFQFLFGGYVELPVELIEKIIEYFSNSELYFFIDKYKLLDDSDER